MSLKERGKDESKSDAEKGTRRLRKKKKSSRCERRGYLETRESEICQKNKWKSVQPHVLLKVEVPVWFFPSP